MDCVRFADLCRQQDISQYPTLRAYTPSHNKKKKKFETVSLHLQHLHPTEVLEHMGLTKILMTSDSSSGDEQDANNNNNYWENNNEPDDDDDSLSLLEKFPPPPRKRSRAQRENDLYLALDSTLRRHAVRHNQQPTTIRQNHFLSPRQTDALRAWLHVLHSTVATTTVEHTKQPRRSFQAVVPELLSNLEYIAKSSDYLLALLDEYYHDDDDTTTTTKDVPPTEEVGKSDGGAAAAAAPDWSPLVCGDNGNKDDTGQHDSTKNNDYYECAFWDLLLTVGTGLVEYNAQSLDADERLSPGHVTEVLREFVQAFGVLDTGGVGDTTTMTTGSAELSFWSATTPATHSDDNEETETEWRQVALGLAAARQEFFRQKRQQQYSTSSKTHDDNKDSTIKQQDDESSLEMLLWPSLRECPVCWTSNSDSSAAHRRPELLYKYLHIEYTSHSLLLSSGETVREYQRDLHDALRARAQQRRHHHHHHHPPQQRTIIPLQQASMLVVALLIVGWRRQSVQRFIVCHQDDGLAMAMIHTKHE